MSFENFESLELSEPIMRGIRAAGYSTATPIQTQAIPIVLDRRDLMGCARTGTGKTAAFAVPTLQRLAHRGEHAPQKGRARGQEAARPIRSLVLAPTRELAAQIAASFSKYGKFTGLRCGVVYGGVDQRPQVKMLRNKVDILVATPGRLLDLMRQGFIDLKNIEILILDEADQMLDMGFLPDLRHIIAAIPRDRQTLMFSATMPDAIRQLAAQWLRDPQWVRVHPAAAPPELANQSVYHVETAHKPELLKQLLRATPDSRTLVFARTKHGADKLVKLLVHAGIRAVAIHGNKSQNFRTRTLEQFRADRPPVLVATDVAARGLDVKEIGHVINYELPEVPEIYVHRIGRTARAGLSGIATSFCSASERSRLQQIERLMRQRIHVQSDQRTSSRSTLPATGGNVAPQPASSKPFRPRKRRRYPAQAMARAGKSR